MNPKTLKPLLYLLVVLFIANSCKKPSNPNPPDVDLNGIFQISNTINLSNVAMYTANGAVTDESIIKAYANRRFGNAAGYFVFDATSIPSDISDNEVDFNGTNATWSGFLPGFANTTPTKYTISQRSSTGFKLVAVDTTQGLVISQDQTDRASDLFTNSNTLNNIINCKTVYSPNGLAQQCTYRNAYPFLIKAGQIYLSMYSFAISSNTPTSAAAYARSNMVGSFNSVITNQLIAGDTLVYQNRTILFKKE